MWITTRNISRRYRVKLYKHILMVLSNAKYPNKYPNSNTNILFWSFYDTKLTFYQVICFSPWYVKFVHTNKNWYKHKYQGENLSGWNRLRDVAKRKKVNLVKLKLVLKFPESEKHYFFENTQSTLHMLLHLSTLNSFRSTFHRKQSF